MIAGIVVPACVLLAIATGVLTYRFCVVLQGDDRSCASGSAIIAACFFPVGLPLIVMLWMCQLPEWREQRAIERARRSARIRRALEDEAFAPLDIQ